MTTYGEDIKTYIKTLRPIMEKIYNEYANNYGDSVDEVRKYYMGRRVFGSNKEMDFISEHNYVLQNMCETAETKKSLKEVNDRIYRYNRGVQITNEMVASAARRTLIVLDNM